MGVNRRSALGLMGAVPLATSGVPAASGTANAAKGKGHGRVPDSLRPGGTLDRFIQEQARKGDFSGTILLVHRGDTVLSRSHGMANRKRSIPNGKDTIFALGSVTKIFTGLAIAQLAERGKVEYGGKLGAYLDGFPAEIAGNVTVHQMLTHTSGMGDYRNDNGKEFVEESATWKSEQQTMNGIMGFVREDKLHFTPGTGQKYSNSAFATLGAIVAKLSNMSYYDYVRRHVFEAARMSSADFYTQPQWRDDPRIAHPYTAMNPSGEVVDNVGERDFIGSPAGDSFSSAPDLVRFTEVLLGHDHRLLGRAFTDLMTSAKVPGPTMSPRPGEPRTIRFNGYGSDPRILNDQWIVGHNGGSPGVNAHCYWYPYSGWATVFLQNQDYKPNVGIVSLAEKLITEEG